VIDHAHVARWLNAYVDAWRSYDPAAIGELFSHDATYRYNPFDDPVQGRDDIVASWMSDRDPSGTYTAHYEPLALNGDTAVARGRSLYFGQDGTVLQRQFDNIFVLRFDAEGRCCDFCEWYMQPRGQE
jgi:ketosteroid isomerase-like protein